MRKERILSFPLPLLVVVAAAVCLGLMISGVSSQCIDGTPNDSYSIAAISYDGDIRASFYSETRRDSPSIPPDYFPSPLLLFLDLS